MDLVLVWNDYFVSEMPVGWWMNSRMKHIDDNLSFDMSFDQSYYIQLCMLDLNFKQCFKMLHVVMCLLFVAIFLV